MPKIKKPTAATFTLDDVPQLVREYKTNQDFSKAAGELAAKFRKELVGLLEQHGEPDDKGHRWIMLEDVEGVKEGVKYERRVSNTIDVDKLSAWLKRKKLWDDVVEVVEQIDEGKLWAAVWDGRISEEDMARFNIETVTWALKVV